MELKYLKKEISFQWKIQTVPKNGKKGCCVAYIDARDAMDLLDEVCGSDNWSDEYYEVRGTMFCKLGIKTESGWVFKSDAGSKPDESSGDDAVVKGEPSDAFKRAGVKWGIGRFLYSKDMVWITEDEYQANKYKITEFCNNTPIRKDSKIPTADNFNSDYYKPESKTDKPPVVWFNDEQFEAFKMKATSYPTFESALKIIKSKYGISREMEAKVRAFYGIGITDVNEKPF